MLFSRTNTISPADAAQRLARGELQLVDVREAEELAGTRIDGASHIPLGELGRRTQELDSGRTIAFLCRSGSRSAMATRAAANAGFDAVNVKGGILAWSKAGLPLAGDPGGRS